LVLVGRREKLEKWVERSQDKASCFLFFSLLLTREDSSSILSAEAVEAAAVS
jgi:hypothetical protein